MKITIDEIKNICKTNYPNEYFDDFDIYLSNFAHNTLPNEILRLLHDKHEGEVRYSQCAIRSNSLQIIEEKITKYILEINNKYCILCIQIKHDDNAPAPLITQDICILHILSSNEINSRQLLQCVKQVSNMKGFM